MKKEDIRYLCINLPWAEKRRHAIESQASRLGLHIEFVEAISGKDLPPEVPQYDSEKRLKTFPNDLLPNEIACILSHIKAMRTFLDSGAEYAVIMEDDALLAENIAEAVQEVTQHLAGWEMAKLKTDNSTLYSLGDKGGMLTRAVFPRKILWDSVGWLYTRRGAEHMLEALKSFSLPADMQIGHYILERQIPVIGITPSLIINSDPHNENSTINAADSSRRISGRRRTLLQYLCYRLSVIRISLGKRRTIRLMRQRLRRV